MKTKNIYIIMSLCLIFSIPMAIGITSCFAQNLVVNGDFETMTSCPASLGQTNRATGWIQATSGTSDYYNACNTSTGCVVGSVDVPSNFSGTQTARTGNGYCGAYFYYYDASTPNDQREYIQKQFSSPLTPNTTYDVSFYVSLAELGCSVPPTATNNQGAYISVTAPTSADTDPSNPGFSPIAFTPQINNAGAVISDMAGWTLVSGTFASGPGGGQNYITIGNFFTDAATTITTPVGTRAYYYIEDVCVTPQGGTGCGFVLPIQLLSFNANCIENNVVHVAWSTATETNNDFFTIERSADAVSWETAGTVKGAGNSTTTLNYELVDNLPSTMDNGLSSIYYRLKQTDYDGKSQTFNDKQVAVDVTVCAAVQVFPNPSGNTLNVPYAAEQDGEVTLEVYDILGKLVKEKTVVATKGNNTFTLDLTTVAQGMYVLRVKAGAKEHNQKFVKE